PFDVFLPFEKLKAEAGLVYHKTFTTVILYTPPMLRYSAMFNEPGVVGTFSALFLIAENFNLHLNKNRIILLGGILSFATSFYFMILIWFIVRNLSRFNLKNILSVVMVFILILFLQNVNTPFAPLNRMIQSTRIAKVNNEWNFIGNNRQNKTFQEGEKNFYSAGISQILFGKGRGWATNSPLIAGSYTYKFLIFDHGILGIILILAWLVIYTYYLNGIAHNPDVKYFVLLFILSIYQRPDVMNIQYLALLIGGIAYNNLQFSKPYTFMKHNGIENKTISYGKIRKLN
ncbi:hypothetical protein, partial [uncultured Cloacibacillus sp.]|uniref:hypothetical protein n=1 Tax=uncultured Cloacibacillus sp. TaxID=889794 RepID=UPI0026DC9409